MFGFRKKKPESFEDLQKIRDLTKGMLGEVINVYVVTTVGYLTDVGGRTDGDVKNAKTEMLAALQKYVLAEILLDKQKHGHDPSLAELVYLRP